MSIPKCRCWRISGDGATAVTVPSNSAAARAVLDHILPSATGTRAVALRVPLAELCWVAVAYLSPTMPRRGTHGKTRRVTWHRVILKC